MRTVATGTKGHGSLFHRCKLRCLSQASPRERSWATSSKTVGKDGPPTQRTRLWSVARRSASAQAALAFRSRHLSSRQPASRCPWRLSQHQCDWDYLRHRRRAFLMLLPAGDKVASEIFAGSLSGVFGNFLGSGVVAGPQPRSGFGKIGALRVGAHAAELAHDDASVLAVGGRKRGRACSNCRSARARSVG